MIITGWSRYDHFLSLCELLPYSIPSLAFSLIAWKEPFRSQPRSDLFQNKALQEYVQKELQCSSNLHLNIQEHTTKSLPKSVSNSISFLFDLRLFSDVNFQVLESMNL